MTPRCISYVLSNQLNGKTISHSIETKEAETMLLKAEDIAAEACEAAKAIGVIIYDITESSQKYYEIKTSNVK